MSYKDLKCKIIKTFCKRMMNMFHTRCFALVPYNTEQMFNLVNDIDSYSQFIPGCNIMKIIQKNDNELTAEINVMLNGIKQSVTTHNFFIKNKSIVIFLVKSPFKSYYGCWNFVPINNVMSSVEYISYYEFQSILFGKICNRIVQKICKNIIKIFITRAKKIYSVIE